MPIWQFRATLGDILTVQHGYLYLFEMQLHVNGTPFDVNFGNTAYFNLALPDGVSFRSSSGVLLSHPIAAAVPEPAGWAMMIAGFGAAGGGLRRNRRTRVLSLA